MLYALANELSTNPFKISSHANTNNKNSINVVFTTAKNSKNLAQTNQATTNTNTNTTTTDTKAISASNNYVRRLSMPSATVATAAPLTTNPTTTTTPVSRIPQPISQHLNTDANKSRKHSLNQFYENTNATDEDALQNKYEYVEFYDEEDEEEEEEQRVNGHEENEETRPLQDNEDGAYGNDDEGEEEDYSQRNNTSQGYREPLLHLRN